MSLNRIRTVLTRALLEDRAMDEGLFQYDLAENIEEWREMMHQDGEDYLIVVTAAENKAAMVLIDAEAVFVNEEARAHLRSLWGDQYGPNMEQMIPEFARSLNDDELPVSGFKIAGHGEA